MTTGRPAAAGKGPPGRSCGEYRADYFATLSFNVLPGLNAGYFFAGT